MLRMQVTDRSMFNNLKESYYKVKDFRTFPQILFLNMPICRGAALLFLPPEWRRFCTASLIRRQVKRCSFYNLACVLVLK